MLQKNLQNKRSKAHASARIETNKKQKKNTKLPETKTSW